MSTDSSQHHKRDTTRHDGIKEQNTAYTLATKVNYTSHSATASSCQFTKNTLVKETC